MAGGKRSSGPVSKARFLLKSGKEALEIDGSECADEHA